MFRHVLNYIRTGVLSIPEGFEEVELLLDEARFFEIQGMVRAIEQLKNQQENRSRKRMRVSSEEGKFKSASVSGLPEVVMVEEVGESGGRHELAAKGSKKGLLACLKRLESSFQNDITCHCKINEDDKSARRNYVEIKIGDEASVKMTDVLAGMFAEGFQVVDCSRTVSKRKDGEGFTNHLHYLLSNQHSSSSESNGTSQSKRTFPSLSSSSQAFPYVNVKREIDEDE